jgi:hypothetical protein
MANVGTAVNTVSANLTGLIAGYTTARAARLDMLDAGVTTRAAQTTADSILSWVQTGVTEQRAGAPVVRSVQRGYIGSFPNDISLSVNISAVNPAKCVVSLPGFSSGIGHSHGAFVSGLSANMLSFTRGSATQWPQGLAWQIVEYY